MTVSGGYSFNDKINFGLAFKLPVHSANELDKEGFVRPRITSYNVCYTKLLRKNKEADMAILQALFGQNAYKGLGPYEGKPVKDFRAVTMLWENVEHFALLGKYVNTGTMLDLKGLHQKFSIGKRGSGTEGSGRTILATLGIDPEKDLIPEYLGYSPSVV